MNKALVTSALLCAGFVGGASAADVNINSFASIVGGQTLSEGDLRTAGTLNGENAVFISDAPSIGIYDDDISFKPDTIFGLQISSQLGDGLSVTGQITGAGGEDFDANIA